MPDLYYRPISLKVTTLRDFVPLSFKGSKNMKGQGYQGGITGHHAKKLISPENCGKYPSCEDCQELDCNWEP